ncbi:hypothetical protein, partial [Sicyoidochytrium minutum DNA virus]
VSREVSGSGFARMSPRKQNEGELRGSIDA